MPCMAGTSINASTTGNVHEQESYAEEDSFSGILGELPSTLLAPFSHLIPPCDL